MRSDKRERMMDAYKGFKGWATVDDITSRIPDELKKQLTGKQLGLIMNAIDGSYKDGTRETGAEVIDEDINDGAVYVNCLGKTIEWKRNRGDLNLSIAE